MHIRTTLIIDDELLAKAQELSGLRRKNRRAACRTASAD